MNKKEYSNEREFKKIIMECDSCVHQHSYCMRPAYQNECKMYINKDRVILLPAKEGEIVFRIFEIYYAPIPTYFIYPIRFDKTMIPLINTRVFETREEAEDYKTNILLG